MFKSDPYPKMKKKDFVLEKLIKIFEEYNFEVRIGHGDIIITVPFGTKRLAMGTLEKCFKLGEKTNEENSGQLGPSD